MEYDRAIFEPTKFNAVQEKLDTFTYGTFAVIVPWLKCVNSNKSTGHINTHHKMSLYCNVYNKVSFVFRKSGW
jgi:hypothetical protein